MRAKGLISTKSGLHELLQQVPLFKGVSTENLEALAHSSFRKKLEQETYLFFRGDPAEDFYLVLSGEIVISLTSTDGRELIINQMHPGDFFGELGLLTGQPRSANAAARRSAELVVIPRQAFLAAMKNEASLAPRLLEATAIRLSRTSEYQNLLAFMDAYARLAWVLLDLDRENEERGYITISQDELAQRAGLIRQTVAKILGSWRRKGWLLTGRGNIMLLNRAALSLWFKQQTT